MVKGWPWTGSRAACLPAVPLLNLTGGEDESPPWLVHPAFSRVPGTWKGPPKAQLGAGGRGWGKEPLPEWVFRCETGLALLGAGGRTVERGPSSAFQLQPPTSTALQWGEGKRGQNGAAGYAPPPSPGQRALGKKDLAKRGVGEREVLEGRSTHVSVDVGVHARVRVCTTCVGE